MTNAIIESGQFRPESENTWTVNVSVFHSGDVSLGETLSGLSPRILARFLSKIRIGQPNQCWLWQAGKFRHGYGMFGAGRDINGKCDVRYAHRLAFELATGVAPGGLVVMHSCDTPACCNPFHLSLGTQGDNVRDAAAKGHYNVPRKRNRVMAESQAVKEAS